jgi:hypothetical protein
MAKGKGKKFIKGVKKAVKTATKVSRALGFGDPGTAAGGFVGGKIGKKFGNKNVGRAIGEFIGTALGEGDYKVSTNALGRSSMNLGAQVPSFGKNGESTIITHREYIGDLISSSTPGAFKITKYSFNPGNSTLFPWLSSMAGNYEQYEPLGAIVSFKSTSADFNATGQALGTVIIASDYDVYDATYSNKIEMENSTFAISCKSSESMLHPIECDPKQRATKMLYVGPPQTQSDKRFHDLCNVQVASVGISAASVNLGEMWITYKFRFHKPQLDVSDVMNLDVSFSGGNNNAANYWIAASPTYNPAVTNNLPNYLSFTAESVGVPSIEFTDQVTWGKYYNVVFAIQASATVASALTITPAATDAQVQVISFNIINVSAITNTNEYACSALIKVVRNETLTNKPRIKFTWNYTASDCVGNTDVTITEVSPRAFA